LGRYAKQAMDQQFARWVMLHVLGGESVSGRHAPLRRGQHRTAYLEVFDLVLQKKQARHSPAHDRALTNPAQNFSDGA
jgi:hypothetical protein